MQPVSAQSSTVYWVVIPICLFTDDLCKLDPDAGPCEAANSRWYFCHKDMRCKQFIYGGCMGNKNNFASESDCIGSCSHMVKKQSAADQQSDAGSQQGRLELCSNIIIKVHG